MRARTTHYRARVLANANIVRVRAERRHSEAVTAIARRIEDDAIRQFAEVSGTRAGSGEFYRELARGLAEGIPKGEPA